MGLKPMFTALSESSKQIAKSTSNELLANTGYYQGEIYLWALFGQAAATAFGALLFVWSDWLAKVIVSEPRSTQNNTARGER